jgi:hypothetical protein
MKKQEILIILIPTLICVAAWIIFNIYDSAITSTISPQEQSQVTYISPNFDTTAITKLSERVRVEPYYKESKLPTPTPIQNLNSNLPKNAQATTGGKLNK